MRKRLKKLIHSKIKKKRLETTNTELTHDINSI